MKKIIMAAWLAFAAFPGSVDAATSLSFISTATSFIGQGMSVNVTPADNFQFSSKVNSDNSLSFLIENLAASPPINQMYWSLTLWGPLNQTLVPGFYDHAGIARDHGKIESPHIFFFGNNRITLSNEGYFTVLEAVYDSTGSVERFAVDFVQFENRTITRRLDGQLRYNSSFSSAVVPEPSTFALFGLGFAATLMLRMSRTTSSYR